MVTKSEIFQALGYVPSRVRSGQNTDVSGPDNNRVVGVGNVNAQGHWSPLTNGNGAAPELIFLANGDTVDIWIAD